MKFSKEIPIIDTTDVLVVGGGPAGIAAAVSSARLGVKTILLERYGYLGGNATTAMVGPFMTSYSKSGKVQVIRGIFDELVTKMEKEGGAIHPSKVEAGTAFSAFYIADHDHVTPFDHESLKRIASNYCLENGVKLKLHSFLVDAFLSKETTCLHPKTNKSIVAVIASKSGLQGIASKIVIDCSGDADVAYRLGLPIEKGRQRDNKMQPATMYFRVRNIDTNKLTDYIIKNYPSDRLFNRPFLEEVKKAREKGEYSVPKAHITLFKSIADGEYRINTSRVLNIDGTDVDDLTKAEVEGRCQVQQILSFIKKYVPGCENAELIDTATQIGIRETRRIKGRYVLTAEDVLKGRTFDDAVVSCAYGLDIHDPEGDTAYAQQIEKEIYQIPYRCLLPKGEDQLLVAGRCISATHEAASAARIMPNCMALGEAAGTAAALSLKNNVLPFQLNTELLRRQLQEQGVYLGTGGIED